MECKLWDTLIKTISQFTSLKTQTHKKPPKYSYMHSEGLVAMPE